MIRRFSEFLYRIRPNNFVLLLGLMIFLAYLTPQIGASKEGLVSLGKLADLGVLLIFFFYGIGMSVSTFWRGLSNWRLHLLIHLSTFLFFPLVVLSVYWLFKISFGNDSNPLLWIGIFYVAALPSTVSSSVVMVSIAKGNMPAAIFNASISGILGVFLTPLWMSFFLGGETTFGTAEPQGIPLMESIQGLVLIVVLPICLGMALNSRFGNIVAKNRQFMKYFDQSVVLLIVYTSFCDSFAAKSFDGFGTKTILLLACGMVALFFTVYAMDRFCCRLARFNREDTIAVLFCGSKKSLMHGMAMSKVLFAGMNGIGVILLPIMLYHALQLVVVSVLAKRMNREQHAIDSPEETVQQPHRASDKNR